MNDFKKKRILFKCNIYLVHFNNNTKLNKILVNNIFSFKFNKYLIQNKQMDELLLLLSLIYVNICA